MKAWNSRAAGAILAAGVVLGGLGMGAWIQGPAKAEAQAEAKASTSGRYQISSFGYGYGYTGTNTTNSQSKYGTYIVDTQTGEVFVIVESGKPHSLGRVGEK